MTKMPNIKLLTEEQKEECNKALKTFSLEVPNGSFDLDTGIVWVNIEKGCAVTYNKLRVAKVLMGILGSKSIMLDGQLITG